MGDTSCQLSNGCHLFLNDHLCIDFLQFPASLLNPLLKRLIGMTQSILGPFAICNINHHGQEVLLPLTADHFTREEAIKDHPVLAPDLQFQVGDALNCL